MTHSSAFIDEVTGGSGFTVLDLETTGFYFRGNDRIVEIGAIRFGPDGKERARLETLVDPGRDVGPTNIHGINASDVRGAPAFSDVVGDLLDVIAGSVVVAHNLVFDWNFLAAECERAGFPVPATAGMCTMRLPGRIGLQLPGLRLAVCCEAFGIDFDPELAHGAAYDALATAHLFVRLAHLAHEQGLDRLDEFCDTPICAHETWPRHTPSQRRHTRRGAAAHRLRDFGFLARLAHHVGGARRIDPDLAPYIDVLSRVLEDHLVTDEEAAQLLDLAEALGLTGEEIERAHAMYFDMLVDGAWADGVVTNAELDQLRGVGHWLGLDGQSVADRVTAARRVAATDPASANRFRGMSVCFTGAMSVGRDRAEDLARQAGLVPQPGVTMGLDLLVVSDPNTQSGKAKKARKYGTRILAEPAFWSGIGVDV